MMVAVPRFEQDIPLVDWHGTALDCDTCPSRAKYEASEMRCELAHACVEDRYAKRVDRFFKWNPHLGNDFLGHPYFEVRAIACRHADVFRLQSLIHDEDETVRLSVAVRLPLGQTVRLRDDPHREVRIRVAMRLEGSELLAMKDDEDYYVRKLVARRVPEGMLSRVMHDREWEVRLEVAKRMPMPRLLDMCDDPEVAVRREVVQRMPQALLSRMAKDPAWEVRWEVAQRADAALARQMSEHDEEPEVRNEALLRLEQLGVGSAPASSREGVRHG
ncbi:4Fe4S-binding leucine-rich repeat protein [Viridibacterium curvum]|uniref:4Fe4S-binding leucine-rich repeat protein n=1 Tax=Viridibacterium curvum TaxID=1101404 RepID=A0ABP9R6G6_9RHOO